MCNNALQSCDQHFHHAVIQLIDTRIQIEIKLVNLANVNERESTASVLVQDYDQPCALWFSEIILVVLSSFQAY